MKKKVLCLVASRSGGHLLPALQLAQQWQKQFPDGKIVLFTSNKKLDQTIISQFSCIDRVVCLRFGSFSARKLWKYPLFCAQFLHSFFKSFFVMKKLKPVSVISTGGLLSFPVAMATSLGRIPLDVYELNVIPGRAVRSILPFARSVYITFPRTRKFLPSSVLKRCDVSRYPLRFVGSDKEFDRSLLLKKPLFSHFSLTRKTLFVIGGSQGSLFLNKLFISWLEKQKTLWPDLQVIHQAGMYDVENMKKWYAQKGIASLVFSFEHDLKYYYQLADLVVTRAGAGTLFELEFFQKRSIVIPLRMVATDHQIKNGEEMVKRNSQLFSMIDPHLLAKESWLFDEEMSRRLDCVKKEHRNF